MQTFDIKGTKRVANGKKAAKALRANGQVPCIIYGGKEPVEFAVPESSFRNLIYTPNVYIVNVDIDGVVKKAILKDIQFHPVTEKILHVDFFEIFDDKPVAIAVPVKLVGNSEGVKAGGKLQLEMRKLSIKGLPSKLLDVLEIDVTNLGLGKVIKVGELKYEGIEILNAKAAVVVAVKLTRAAIAAQGEAK
ncbi:MAG: 50S ribosomal protein L25/general stress protein Ctc [Bacteroidales bacterium]|nr:50S ribosomal protein L25/general stress protein Ctc [Bacteroidales bacterium]